MNITKKSTAEEALIRLSECANKRCNTCNFRYAETLVCENQIKIATDILYKRIKTYDYE